MRYPRLLLRCKGIVLAAIAAACGGVDPTLPVVVVDTPRRSVQAALDEVDRGDRTAAQILMEDGRELSSEEFAALWAELTALEQQQVLMFWMLKGTEESVQQRACTDSLLAETRYCVGPWLVKVPRLAEDTSQQTHTIRPTAEDPWYTSREAFNDAQRRCSQLFLDGRTGLERRLGAALRSTKGSDYEVYSPEGLLPSSYPARPTELTCVVTLAYAYEAEALPAFYIPDGGSQAGPLSFGSTSLDEDYLAEAPFDTADQQALYDKYGVQGATVLEHACSTCQDLPSATTEQARAKFDCILAHHDSPETPDKAEIRRFAKQFGEFYRQALSPGQRSRLLELYVADIEQGPDVQMPAGFDPDNEAFYRQLMEDNHYWMSNPDCGATRSVRAACLSFDPHLDAYLQYCGRVADNDTLPAAALRSTVDDCAGLVELTFDASDASCDVAAYASQSRQVYSRLLHRTFMHAGADDERLTPVDLRARMSTVARWYEIFTGRLPPQELDRELMEQGARFWATAADVSRVRRPSPDLARPDTTPTELEVALERAEDLQEADNTDEARRVLQDALGTTQLRVATLQQDALKAALGDVEGAASLQGVPLGMFAAEALQALVERLETLSLYHDVSCAIVPCRTFEPGEDLPTLEMTSIARLWRSLATIVLPRDTPEEDEEHLVLKPGSDQPEDDPWVDLLEGLRDGLQLQQLETLLARIVGAADYDPKTFQLETVENLPEPLMSLAALVLKADARWGSYKASGFFLLQPGRLTTSLDLDRRAEVKDRIDRLTRELLAEVESYKRNLATTLGSVVAEIDGKRDASELRGRVAALREKKAELEERRAAHIKAAEADHGFSGLFDRFARAQESLEDGRYVKVTELPVMTPSGLSSRSGDGETVSSLSFLDKPFEVGAGQVLHVTATGEWAPNCLLQRLLRNPRRAREDDPELVEITNTEITTGPEGYAVSWTGSSFTAEARTTSHGTTHTSQTSDTQGVNVSPNYFGVGFGGSRNQSTTDSEHDTEEDRHSSGVDRRTSASFTSGLHMEDAPFFSAPVGSLVAVQVRQREDDIRRVVDVHLVPSTGATIPVHIASDFYLVVNDRSCASDGTQHLTVRAAILEDEIASSQSFLANMSRVLRDIHVMRDATVKRGVILPTEMAALRAEALDQVAYDADGNRLDAIPEALSRLFDAFLNRELGAMERSVHVRNLDLEIAQLWNEEQRLVRSLLSTETKGHLLEMQKAWDLANLDTQWLFWRSEALREELVGFLLPVMQLWYPDASDAPAVQTTASRLRRMGLGATLGGPDGLAESFAQLALAVAGQYDAAAFAAANSTARNQLQDTVVISIPRPTSDDGLLWTSTVDGEGPDSGGLFGPDEGGDEGLGDRDSTPPTLSASGFLPIDPARAAAFWQGVDDARITTLQILPEDLISPVDGRLGCRAERPIVRYAAIVVPDDSPESGENGMYRWIDGQFGSEQRFVDAHGHHLYAVTDDRLRSFRAPLLYYPPDVALASVAQQAALEYGRKSKLLGLSPFGDLTFDFRILADERLPDYGIGRSDEILLVFVVERDPNGAAVDWVSGCHDGL